MINYKDILIRAGKTFLQTLLATVSVGLTGVTGFSDLGVLGFAALIAAIASLVSFLQNLLIQIK